MGIENNYKNIFKYSHSIDYISNDQLIVSGAVQYWGKSDNSKKLLEKWHTKILENEGTPDDHCLDFSFNNLDVENNLDIKKFWLPKSYARYAWWIFDKPIINHPQFPYNGSSVVQIKEEHGMKRFYVEKMTLKKPKRMLNENEIFNCNDKKVYSIRDGSLVFERVIDSPLWINS